MQIMPCSVIFEVEAVNVVALFTTAVSASESS